MIFLKTVKDGGPDSLVWAYFLIEIKSLFSIVLLRFENGSRDAYHTHAFNCISWVLSGCLIERLKTDTFWPSGFYLPSFKPIITRRDTFHKVKSVGRTWVISFRGPWSKTWKEYIPGESKEVTLTHGRKRIEHEENQNYI